MAPKALGSPATGGLSRQMKLSDSGGIGIKSRFLCISTDSTQQLTVIQLTDRGAVFVHQCWLTSPGRSCPAGPQRPGLFAPDHPPLFRHVHAPLAGVPERGLRLSATWIRSTHDFTHLPHRDQRLRNRNGGNETTQISGYETALAVTKPTEI